MTEVIIHQATLHSAIMDEFYVYVTALPGGDAAVMSSQGMLKPLVATIGHPVRISLRMPYTPGDQNLRLTITREDPAT